VEPRLVLKVIDALDSIDDAASFGHDALSALSLAIEFDHGSYNEIDTSTSAAYFCTWPSELPDNGADRRGFPDLVRENPILRHQERTDDRSSRRLSDFVTVEELHELGLYQRVYRHIHVEYQLAVALAVKEPVTIAFALNRQHSDFSDEDVAVLDMLRPHLVQAYRNAQLLTVLRGIDDVLAESGRALVVLGNTGVDARAAPRAQAALAAHFGEPRVGVLPEPVAEWIAEERRDTFDDGEPRIHRPLVSVVGDRQLVVRFLPGGASRPDILAVDEDEPERLVAELTRLGLTSREAEILAVMMRGISTAEAAQRLEVTPSTLNKHLQHIYRKLGVASRTAAIAAATDAVFGAR
jgi:DNA-binding CsgD family transcriptional regulator